MAWYHNQDLVLADISPGAAAGEVLYRGGISDELSLDHRPQRLLVHQLVHRGESCQVGTLGTKPREVVRAFRCSFLANDTILAIDDRTVESGGTGDYLATVLTLDGRQLAQRHLPDFPEGSTSGNQLTGGAGPSGTLLTDGTVVQNPGHSTVWQADTLTRIGTIEWPGVVAPLDDPSGAGAVMYRTVGDHVHSRSCAQTRRRPGSSPVRPSRSSWTRAIDLPPPRGRDLVAR